MSKLQGFAEPGRLGRHADNSSPADLLASHQFSEVRPFFCQVEAVETIIWLTKGRPTPPAIQKILTRMSPLAMRFRTELFRLAAEMATKPARRQSRRCLLPGRPRMRFAR